jgi:hypothetical protein
VRQLDETSVSRARSELLAVASGFSLCFSSIRSTVALARENITFDSPAERMKHDDAKAASLMDTRCWLNEANIL